jgi:hypothetical protein
VKCTARGLQEARACYTPQANHWLVALAEDGAGLYRFRLRDPLLENLRGDPEFERIRARTPTTPPRWHCRRPRGSAAPPH